MDAVRTIGALYYLPLFLMTHDSLHNVLAFLSSGSTLLSKLNLHRDPATLPSIRMLSEAEIDSRRALAIAVAGTDWNMSAVILKRWSLCDPDSIDVNFPGTNTPASQVQEADAWPTDSFKRQFWIRYLTARITQQIRLKLFGNRNGTYNEFVFFFVINVYPEFPTPWLGYSVLTFDRRLDELEERLPPELKAYLMQTELTPVPEWSLRQTYRNRYSVLTTLSVARITLHRPFLTRPRDDSKYNFAHHRASESIVRAMITKAHHATFSVSGPEVREDPPRRDRHGCLRHAYEHTPEFCASWCNFADSRLSHFR